MLSQLLVFTGFNPFSRQITQSSNNLNLKDFCYFYYYLAIY